MMSGPGVAFAWLIASRRETTPSLLLTTSRKVVTGIVVSIRRSSRLSILGRNDLDRGLFMVNSMLQVQRFDDGARNRPPNEWMSRPGRQGPDSFSPASSSIRKCENCAGSSQRMRRFSWLRLVPAVLALLDPRAGA